MNALAIDCSVSKITIAAKKENQMVKLTLDIGSRQSEKLLPAIDFVMKELELLPSDLNYTTCTLGPGSFTGLRLGSSALKALTLSHNIDLYGIPSLDAYSYPYRNLHTTVLSVIEAKEDEFFFSLYNNGEKLTAEADELIEDILKKIDVEGEVFVCGSGAKTFAERASELSPLHKFNFIWPENDTTESLFLIAEEQIRNKVSPLQDYDGPLYVRKSEAEIVLEKSKTKE